MFFFVVVVVDLTMFANGTQNNIGRQVRAVLPSDWFYQLSLKKPSSPYPFICPASTQHPHLIIK